MSLTNVSKILKAFKKKDLASCLTPELKTGMVYELTDNGKKIRESIVRK